MRKGLKILGLVSGGLIAILAGLFFSIESYRPFAAYIDTRFFRKIQHRQIRSSSNWYVDRRGTLGSWRTNVERGLRWLLGARILRA
jgi:hypothetical protein